STSTSASVSTIIAVSACASSGGSSSESVDQVSTRNSGRNKRAPTRFLPLKIGQRLRLGEGSRTRRGAPLVLVVAQPLRHLRQREVIRQIRQRRGRPLRERERSKGVCVQRRVPLVEKRVV